MKTELFAVTNATLLQETINDFIRDKKVLDIIQLAKSDGVARISADTPITYLGFKKWK